MRNVFMGIVSLLVNVNSQVVIDNGVCYKIDNGVRAIEDCPPGTLPQLPQLPPGPSTTRDNTDDNPTGHEANSTSSTTTSLFPTSTSSSSDNVSSNAIEMFSGMALGSVLFAFVFLF